jgi:dTDP-4-amino-4,6-dideoxygalactose transaminase
MEISSMNFKVPYNYLPKQFEKHHTFFDLWKPVLESGEFTLGPFVQNFEEKFADYIGAKYCIATNNGTDALILALKALGITHGDEVITPCNSFYATAGAIVAAGGTPVFADVDDRYQIQINEIYNLITNKTKMILPVHWAGASPDMLKIKKIAKDNNLFLVEDACMAIGGKIHDNSPGTLSDIGAYSMHPLKSLNVAGDGGMVVTDNEYLYKWMKKYRNHGMSDRNSIEFWGVNMRIQPLQAVISNYFLDYLDEIIEKRNKNALYLDNLLTQLGEYVKIPPRLSENVETFSLYMIQVEKRDRLFEYLNAQGIEAKIHYPTPLHLQPASKKMGYNKRVLPKAELQAKKIITLPIHQYINESQLEYISQEIHNFYTHYQNLSAKNE